MAATAEPKATAQNIENITINDIVTVIDGTMFTTSLIVAKVFEKNHKDVLKAIDNMECSPTFQRTDFSGPPAAESSRKALNGLLDAWVFFGENKMDAANYVCLACNAPSLQTISEKNLPKATLAAFMGFIDRLPA